MNDYQQRLDVILELNIRLIRLMYRTRSPEVDAEIRWLLLAIRTVVLAELQRR